ncbi:MAG: hypothetical protein FD180_1802 [Planctomycetota bacterium]|nr:MAG: hypothetical protein FD180_1802 [Planctomycetota bacterium]
MIEENWVSTWHNQCPGLYCNNTADTRKPIPYPSEQFDTVYEGVGGGNIRLFFCDKDGRIIYAVTGYLSISSMMDAERFAQYLLPLGERHRKIACEMEATSGRSSVKSRTTSI